MATQTEDLRADGNVKVVFLTGADSIANLSAPTVSELTGANALDLSCFIKSDGRTHTIDQASIDNSKLCDTTNHSAPGRVTHTWSLTYARKANAADDKAYDTLKNFTGGILVERIGLPVDTAFAADQKVHLYTVTCGEQNEKADANDIVWVDSQSMFVSGEVERDATVAA